MKKQLKKLIKLSPIPLTKNHKYDLQTKKIISRLRTNFNSIDVGCHKGEILDLILKKSPEGHHFGIEAVPFLYNKLKEKYSDRPNCRILNFAANNEIGEIEFNFVVTNPSYSGILRRDYDKPNEKDKTIKVKSDKLDNYIPKNIKIDLIKIDVEGAEYQVIEGSLNLIKKDKPKIIFEHGLGASHHYGITPRKLYKLFQNCGLRISNLGSFLRNKKSLTIEEFENQYIQKKNYYFIAH